MYEKKQEKLRKTLKGAEFCDKPELFQAKKKMHTLKLIRLTQDLSFARRHRELISNTVGDPINDQLNKIWKNMVGLGAPRRPRTTPIHRTPANGPSLRTQAPLSLNYTTTWRKNWM